MSPLVLWCLYVLSAIRYTAFAEQGLPFPGLRCSQSRIHSLRFIGPTELRSVCKVGLTPVLAGGFRFCPSSCSFAGVGDVDKPPEEVPLKKNDEASGANLIASVYNLVKH